MQNHSELGLWERALAQLSDTVYLDIVRNFIGKVPTPFHKPQLTEQLTNLFTNPEFLKQLFLRLSEDDIHILFATYLIGSPTQDELCSLFTYTRSYATLWQNLVNLEERLLLVPNPNSSDNRYEILINPLIQEKLIKTCFTSTTLFHTAEGKESRKRYVNSSLHTSILRALISLHMHEQMGDIEKSERVLQNRYLAQIFGAVDEMKKQYILHHNRLLFREKVLEENGKTISVNHAISQEFLSLNPDIIHMKLCINAWLQCYATTHKSTSYPSYNNLQDFFTTFFIILQKLNISTEQDLLIALKIAAFRNRIPLFEDSIMLSLLQEVGISLESSDKSLQDETKVFLPTMDSDLTISYSGTLPVIDGKDYLHMIAIVRKVDIVSSYEINKHTILHAFDYGLSVDDICDYLEALTRKSCTQVKNLITHWREEFASITIYDGIVVKADDRQSRIIEALPQLQPYIIARISQGLFLLSRKDESQWRKILFSAGSSMLPSSIKETNHIQTVRMSHEHIDWKYIVSNQDSLYEILRSVHNERPNHVTEQESLENQLRKDILGKARSKSEQEEMLARLEKKLILVPSQVQAVQGPSQTIQASGFDHQGKINLCKSAVQSSVDLLELNVLDDDGVPSTILTEAKELITSAKEPSVRVHVLPHGEERVIPIKSIFKMRKLRRSIFFQL